MTRPLSQSTERRARYAALITGEVSVGRAVLTLAMPVLAEQLLNSAVGLCDVYLAGRISVDATAAIGLGAYVAWLMSMLFMLVGTGTTALVARFAGAGKADDCNHYANQSVSLAVIVGLGLTILLLIAAPTLARLQNMTGERFDVVVRYLRIDASGYLFTSLTLIGAAALRGVGDMRTPLAVLAVVNVVNIAVSFSLVYGLGPIAPLGVDGIVLGTVAGRTVGGLLMIWLLGCGCSGLRLARSMRRLSLDPVRRILGIGGPAAMDGLIMWAGHFVFLMIVANLAAGELGAAYYAAHIIGVRIEALTYLPAVAWATATATIVGQSLGAGNPQRAIQAGHRAVWQCGMVAAASTLFYYFGADLIYHWMHNDTLVRREGPPALRLVAFFQVFLAASIIYVGALRGAGDTRVPLLITIVCVGCLRLPLGYLFGVVFKMGLVGAWIGMCADLVGRAALAAVRFSRGRWTGTNI